MVLGIFIRELFDLESGLWGATDLRQITLLFAQWAIESCYKPKRGADSAEFMPTRKNHRIWVCIEAYSAFKIQKRLRRGHIFTVLVLTICANIVSQLLPIQIRNRPFFVTALALKIGQYESVLSKYLIGQVFKHGHIVLMIHPCAYTATVESQCDLPASTLVAQEVFITA